MSKLNRLRRLRRGPRISAEEMAKYLEQLADKNKAEDGTYFGKSDSIEEEADGDG